MSANYKVTFEALGGIHEAMEVPGDWVPATDDTGVLYFSLKGKTMLMINSAVWREVKRVELLQPVDEGAS